MTLAASRVLGTTWRDWHVPKPLGLTRPDPKATIAPSLATDAGETGLAPAPKGNRPGNSQAKGPHRIGLSGE
jgi:hypothetical protein